MNTALDFLSLECFLLAARHLNFRSAARIVSLSPTAFGQRIAGLERELGGRLFERTTRRVTLTECGTRAVPLVLQLLTDLEGLKREMTSDKIAPYSLTVGTRFELGLSWITPSLKALAKVCPERSLHLSFGDGEDMVDRVRNFQVDASVTSSRKLPPGAQYATLHQEEYVFVSRKSLVNKIPLSKAKDAANHTLIDIDGELPLFRYFLDGQGGKNPWTFQRVEMLGTIAAIKQRVLEGEGVAVLPKYFVNDDLKRKRLIRILPKETLKSDAFRLVWLGDHPRQEALLQLAEDLRALPLI